MKKIITILCTFALILSLVGCAKIRDLNCYSIGEYGDGWSILYTDEDGVEEIIPIGSYEQPLAFEKGRFYFVQNGCMVSVDPEGENRLEVAIDNLPEGALITFVDEENYYCLADRSGRKCWRVNKTDSTDHEEMDLPRQFRPTDYRDLWISIRSVIPTAENDIRVRSARAQLDSNGNLLALDVELLCYEGIRGNGMKNWRTCRVETAVSLAGIQSNYINENILLSLSDSTVSVMLPLDDYLDTLKAIDTAQIATARTQGAAESFRVAYLADEYEAYATENKGTLPCVNTAGEPRDAGNGRRFVLAQVGGCDTALTDRDGTACGNLTVVQLG